MCGYVSPTELLVLEYLIYKIFHIAMLWSAMPALAELLLYQYNYFSMAHFANV